MVLVGADDFAADPIEMFGDARHRGDAGSRCWRSRKSDDSMTARGFRSS